MYLAYLCGEVSELADEHDLGSCAERRGGSNPPFPTIFADTFDRIGQKAGEIEVKRDLRCGASRHKANEDQMSNSSGRFYIGRNGSKYVVRRGSKIRVIDRQVNKMMNKVKIIVFSLIPLLILVLISEISLNIYNFSVGGLTGFPFNKIVNIYKNNENEGIKIYSVPWDFEKEEMRPGEYVTEKGVHYVVNSLGFRGKEFNPYNKAKYRIICFGGSSTLGLESPEDKTYPALLEKKLNENGIDAEVLNFGFGSKSLYFAEKLLLREAISYKPDLITIYLNRNVALYDADRNIGVDIVYGVDIMTSKFDYYLFKLHTLLDENLMTYRAVNHVQRKIKEKLMFHDEEPFNPRKEYFENTYPATLERIMSLGKIHDFKVCLIKQPLYIDPDLQQKIKDYSIEQLWDMLIDKNNEFYQTVAYHGGEDPSNFMSETILTNAILNKHLDILHDKHKDLIVVDPLDDFLGGEVNYSKLFNDYVHLKPEGNDLLSQVIFEKIRPTVLDDYGNN